MTSGHPLVGGDGGWQSYSAKVAVALIWVLQALGSRPSVGGARRARGRCKDNYVTAFYSESINCLHCKDNSDKEISPSGSEDCLLPKDKFG